MAWSKNMPTRKHCSTPTPSRWGPVYRATLAFSLAKTHTWKYQRLLATTPRARPNNRPTRALVWQSRRLHRCDFCQSGQRKSISIPPPLSKLPVFGRRRAACELRLVPPYNIQKSKRRRKNVLLILGEIGSNSMVECIFDLNVRPANCQPSRCSSLGT